MFVALSYTHSAGELAGSDLRLQRLKEWRAKRDEARQKEKASKKKPFSYGGRRPGMTGHTTGSKVCIYVLSVCKSGR